ncbi:MAG: ABC transporter ATP-binding protein [Clostridiales Family XIII bacterium]|jgi:branched-chain amino acid transport system ATP-binding protein|nr:ABC transporter ATP-binding protein [Clostridiales Family XIII bacterium]
MLLNISELKVSVGGLNILHGLDMSVDEGEIVVVVGSNGAGKSTLMRAISGLIRPSSGLIELDGEHIQGAPPYEIMRKGVSLVPEGRMLFHDMTVLENIQLGAYHYRKDSVRIRKNMDRVFGLFPALDKYRDRRSSTLSGGEQQMLSIGRGLMSEPRMLMLDELSLGLAKSVIDMLLKIVKQLNGGGMSILMVEQNVRQALKIADRAYVLDNGRMTLKGTGDELLSNEHVQKAYMGL